MFSSNDRKCPRGRFRGIHWMREIHLRFFQKSDCETFNPNKPTREWREIQKDKFSEIQNRIIEIRNDGKTNSRLTTSKAIEVDSSDSCLTFCQENDPKLSAILTLDQRQLEELIEILSSYLSDIVTAPKHLSDFATFSWLTKWIYSALACLRLPLEPEVHNCIRMIAKSCVQVTNHLKTLPDISGDSFLHWNLIVVVIATNFSQFDLLSL